MFKYKNLDYLYCTDIWWTLALKQVEKKKAMIGNIHQGPLNKSMAAFKSYTKSNKVKNIILGSIHISSLHLKGKLE